MTPNLDQYFERIAYNGPREPTLDVLNSIHRGHVFTFPYENLDVVLQRPVDQDIRRIFKKMVRNRRGGWCYEQNGLLGWALSAVGFNVTRMTGGVMRAVFGDGAWGNHLVLRVDLEESWIADAGLGDAIVQPVPLKAGVFNQDWRSFQLEHLGKDDWRFHNRENASPLSFDVKDRIADEDLFTTTSTHLQEDAGSMFRQNLTCQLMTQDGTHALLGRVLRNTGAHKSSRHLIQSEDELEYVLQTTFSINTPDLTGLWEHVVARHQELFGDTPVDEIRFGPPRD